MERLEKAITATARMHVLEESDHAIVCVEQRVAQEG